MIKFHEKPGILLEAVPKHEGSFMVKMGCHNVKVKLNFTSDKHSQVAVQNFIHAYRTLFEEECIGPEGGLMSLYEIVGDPPKMVDYVPPGEPFVGIAALPPPSRWTRFKRWIGVG